MAGAGLYEMSGFHHNVNCWRKQCRSKSLPALSGMLNWLEEDAGRTLKTEIRTTKYETNKKFEAEMSETRQVELGTSVLRVSVFRACFGVRHSDFVRRLL
jgi:hypothetical protein